MNILSSSVFWGVIIILIGVSIILKQVFNINFPVFRVIAGLFFIFLGAKILIGGWEIRTDKGTLLFSESNIEYAEGQREYNIIFGTGLVDLSTIPAPFAIEKVEVNVIFGKGVIKLNQMFRLK